MCVTSIRVAYRSKTALKQTGVMPRVRERRLYGLQFAAEGQLALLCPAHRSAKLLLEPGADGPLEVKPMPPWSNPTVAS
jgi:hypothetical protein